MTTASEAPLITQEWIDTQEQRAALAERVTLPIAEFKNLLSLARGGMRPIAVVMNEDLVALLARAVNGPWLDGDLERARGLIAQYSASVRGAV